MSRGTFLAAFLLAIGLLRSATAQVASPLPPLRSPADTGTGRDTTRADSTKDTLPHYLPVLPAATPEGPLPSGSRYTFTADSFAFSDTRTLADLLGHIPGVYLARGGPYGQTEAVMYGGRGPAALEVYWDGLPYLPLGRDSVYLDPARIPLSPLGRVEVIVLPAMLRVYLVTAQQRSTAPATEVAITTGVFSTAGYRGTYLKRWRSGVGLSLVADWNSINDVSGSGTTAFHSVDLWLRGEYVPSPRVGASFQLLSSDWNRSDIPDPPVDPFHSKRVSDIARVFLAARPDGLGPRLDVTLATTAASQDTAVADRSLRQGSIELSSLWSRASAAIIARVQSDPIPFELEARAAWNPLFPLTLAADARHRDYSLGGSGDRAHLAVGLALPLGFSAHGDVAWGKDRAAPARADDTLQTANDLFGAIRWQTRWAMLEVGGARRDAFTAPPDFPAGLLTVSALDSTPATNYLSIQASVRPVPGVTVSGWYFNPVQGGGDFEPPKHARFAVTFYSKFWRTYRSGIFAFRADAAAETWSGPARAGVLNTTTGAEPLTLPGATFIDLNAQIRVAGVTFFWTNRNARASHGGYVPNVGYPSTYQVYGVRWQFTN